MDVTDRQRQVLEYIQTFQEREGFPPSLREMCEGLGLASPGSLTKHIRALEAKGYLTSVPGKKRAWRLSRRVGGAFIPVVGQIAAGTPILAQEHREDEIPVDPNLFGSRQAFALRVKGDSMIEAHIRDGDLAIIRPQQDAQSGEIVAVIVEGLETEATLKIFRRRDSEIELSPANSSYQAMIFRGTDRERIRVLGKLVGIIRRQQG